RARAEAEYAAGQYTNASGTFKKLLDKFPDSLRAPDYRSFQDLCELLAQLNSVTSTPETTLEKTNQFFKDREGGFLKQHGAKAGESFHKWLKNLTQSALDKKITLAPDVLAKARETLVEVARVVPEGIPPDAVNLFDKGFTDVQKVVERSAERKNTLDRLQELASRPTLKSIREARRLIEQQNRIEPGFKQAKEVLDVLGTLQKGQ